MKIGACGIACEKCPRMQKGKCPNGEKGCVPRKNEFCKINDCAFTKGMATCFDCTDFPCELTKQGPMGYGFCQYISGRAGP